MSTAAPARISTAPRTGSINRWWFVVAGFISMIVGVNTIYSLFNVLKPSISAEFGWDVGSISGALSYFLVADGISVFVMGLLITRFGLRRVTIPLAAVYGLALASLAFTPDNIGYLYAMCIVAGLAVGPSTQVAHSIIITAWFGKNRGMALGILNVGLGLCGTIMPFIIGGLLAAVGWRGAFAVIGLASAIVPIVAFAVVSRMPAGFESARLKAAREGRAVGVPFLTIVRTSKAFWLISISILFISAGTTGVLGQVVTITTGQGATMAEGLLLLSIVSFSSIASRFVVGALLDRMWAPLLGAIVFILCAVGVGTLSHGHGFVVLLIGAILVGVGLGSEGDIAAYVTSRYIPELSYSRVYGFIIFLFAQGSALGVFMLGFSVTLTGSVNSAAWMIVGMSVIAGVILLFLGPYLYKTDGTTAVEGALESPDDAAVRPS